MPHCGLGSAVTGVNPGVLSTLWVLASAQSSPSSPGSPLCGVLVPLCQAGTSVAEELGEAELGCCWACGRGKRCGGDDCAARTESQAWGNTAKTYRVLGP